METSAKLSFSDYQKEISKTIDFCNNEKLNLFCHDVVSRMLPFVDAADVSNLFESEVSLLNTLRQQVENYPVDWVVVNTCLDSLTEISEQDEDHAQDMNFDIVEFLCALDNWRNFHQTVNKNAVCSMSENLMNILDYYFIGDTNLENWLTVTELNIEFNKQILFLRNNP